MKKIILLQPPIQDFYDTEVRLQPMGLCYLKAAVQKWLPHWEAKVLDFHHGWGRRTLAIPKELKYLTPYYPYPDQSPFRLFHSYFHFGASFETLAERVAEERPDLVGISSLFSPYYREVLACAEQIKRHLDVPILVGGSHVSADPHSILDHPAVDFILRGEGERPLVEFLKVWEGGGDISNVPNLGFKKNGLVQLNSLEENFPLEDLPPPDLSDFLPADYAYSGKPMSFLVSSRSCPHRCSFCSVHATFGFNYRRNSVDRVFAEIVQRYEQGYRVVDFEDDNLSFYTQEMKQLCRRLIERFSDRQMQFVAMNGISYLSLDEEVLHLMHRAGFTHLNLALVSSDTTVRESTKRPHTVEKFLEVVDIASRLGFKIVAYQILGLPNESLESMIQTLVFMARLPVLLGSSPFYLTPNSPIARQLGHQATPEDVFKSRLTAMAIETERFQREDLYTLWMTTRILDFLKGLSFDGEEISLEEIIEKNSTGASDPRAALGFEILEKLFHQGILHAATPQGLKPLTKFKTDLFQRVWESLEFLTTQEGKRIRTGAGLLRKVS